MNKARYMRDLQHVGWSQQRLRRDGWVGVCGRERRPSDCYEHGCNNSPYVISLFTTVCQLSHSDRIGAILARRLLRFLCSVVQVVR